LVSTLEWNQMDNSLGSCSTCSSQLQFKAQKSPI